MASDNITEIILPDYTKVLPDTTPGIPEKYEDQYSAPELIDKVKRKIIRGRVDGN